MKEIISRQLKWQRKMMEEGRCVICGKPAIPKGKYCVRCWLNQYIRYASRRKKPVKFKNSGNSQGQFALAMESDNQSEDLNFCECKN